jgi:Ni,Fe-hydrogenase III component G
MDTESLLQKALELIEPWVRWSKTTQPGQLTVSISRANLMEAVAALQQGGWGYLSAITGLHLPGIESQSTDEKKWSRVNNEGESLGMLAHVESFIVLYHFCEGPAVLTLRVHPPSLLDNNVPSICNLIPSATLYERELMEMFGIEVVGTPNTDKLVLPDDWPQGIHPLRKSFTGLPSTAGG